MRKASSIVMCIPRTIFGAEHIWFNPIWNLEMEDLNPCEAIMINEYKW